MKYSSRYVERAIESMPCNLPRPPLAWIVATYLIKSLCEPSHYLRLYLVYVPASSFFPAFLGTACASYTTIISLAWLHSAPGYFTDLCGFKLLCYGSPPLVHLFQC